MPRMTPEEKLAALKAEKEAKRAKFDKQLDQISNQIKSTQAKLAEKERKIDTRRKIIAGAVALEHAEKNPEWGKDFLALLSKAVTRKDDRELLGLPPLTSPPD